jgi:hypothetical protein
MSLNGTDESLGGHCQLTVCISTEAKKQSILLVIIFSQSRANMTRNPDILTHGSMTQKSWIHGLGPRRAVLVEEGDEYYRAVGRGQWEAKSLVPGRTSTKSPLGRRRPIVQSTIDRGPRRRARTSRYSAICRRRMRSRGTHPSQAVGIGRQHLMCGRKCTTGGRELIPS